MKHYKQLACMVAWTPPNSLYHQATSGKVAVGPWPDTKGWSDSFSSTSGACYADRHKMPEWQRIAMLFIDFHTIVVRDGIDTQAAHEAFLAIDEYRWKISPDTKGATDEEDETTV
jgi:hypothetical protein